jgi:hypothetical protein
MKMKKALKPKKSALKISSGKVLTYYPTSHVLIYNGATVLHFFLGAYLIVAGYDFLWFRYLFGLFYLMCAFIHSYVILPLVVCPNCSYFALENTRCVSGLNIISAMITVKGTGKNFKKRTRGIFCHDNIFWLIMLFPLPAVIPAFIINFSVQLLLAGILHASSLFFRIAYIVPQISCEHCRAHNDCTHYQKIRVYARKFKIH